jgi:mono/diheme cytochrome c family protein
MTGPRHISLVVFGILCGFAIVFLALLFVLAPFALTHKNSGTLESWYGDTAVSLVSGLGGGEAAATSPDAMARGHAAYENSCAQCHGALGDGKGAYGQSTFPPATDLTSPAARSKSDAQLFRIIKDGLGFTAMPGYASQYHDEDIAALAGYVRTLQHG